jgi:hypothetical protein
VRKLIVSANKYGCRSLSQHSGIRVKLHDFFEYAPFIQDDKMPRLLIHSRRGIHGISDQIGNFIHGDGLIVIFSDTPARQDRFQYIHDYLRLKKYFLQTGYKFCYI